MRASVMLANNVPVTTPLGEPARSKGPAGQADGKPRQRFADVLPLVAGEAVLKSGKAAINGIPAADRRNSRQASVDVPTPRESLAPANKGTPTLAINPPGSDTRVGGKAVKKEGVGQIGKKGQQVGVKEGITDSAALLSPSMTPSELPAAKIKPAKAPVPAEQARPASSPQVPNGNGGSVEPPVPTKQWFVVTKSQAPVGKEVTNIERGVVAAPETVRPAKQNGGTARFVEADAKQAQVQVPRAQNDKGASEVPQNLTGNAQRSSQPTVAGHCRSDPAGPRANVIEAGDAGPNTAVVTKALSNGHAVAAENRSDRTLEKLQVVRQDPGTETLSKPQRSTNSPRADTRRNVTAGHEVSPPGRSVKEGIVQLGGKEAAAFRPKKDGLYVRSEAPTAAAVGEPTLSQRSATVPRVSANGTAIKNPTQGVGEQILDSMRASLARGENQLLIRLHPPELGSVVVRFREESGHISGLLEVSKSETRREIEQALPEVLRNLQEAGVEVRKLDVVTSDQPQRQFGKGQPQQDASPQQHGSGQEQEYPQASSQARWPQTGTSYPTDAQEGPAVDPQMNTAPGRIDMLL